MSKIKYCIVGMLLIGMAIAVFYGCSKREGFGIKMTALNSSLEETDQIDVLDTLLVGVTGLKPLAQYDLQILRADGSALFVGDIDPDTVGIQKGPIPMRLTSDKDGKLPPTVMWPEAGIDVSPGEKADKSKLEVKSYKIVLSGEGVNLTLPFFTINNAKQPKVWASDINGNVENSFKGVEVIYVTGMNFPPKKADETPNTVTIKIIEDKSRYSIGETIPTADATIPNVAVNSDGTIFCNTNWTAPLITKPEDNAFDVVVDINNDGIFNKGEYKDASNQPLLNIRDAVDGTLSVGFVVQVTPPGSIPAYIVQELSHIGFDPADNFAITPQMPSSWWWSPHWWSPGVWTHFNALLNYGSLDYWQLVRVWVLKKSRFDEILLTSDKKIHPKDDVSGGFENIHVQYRCWNSGPFLIWPAPLTLGDYVIVIDVNHNNKFENNIDIVDGIKTIDVPNYPGGVDLPINIGFTVP